MFMAPAILFAALVPIGALVFVQAEHDTRGFSDLPSPDEALAEQVRKQNMERGAGPRNEFTQSTRSREVLLRSSYDIDVHPPMQPAASVSYTVPPSQYQSTMPVQHGSVRIMPTQQPQYASEPVWRGGPDGVRYN